MDNNSQPNFPPQQPYPPMPNQPQYPQQPYPPMPNQPYGYQAPQPRPPKQPMNPKKKKAIITWCCVGGGVVVLGIAAAIILPILFRVDYSTAYKTAKEVDNEVYEIYNNYDCESVIDYLSSTDTTVKTYEEYIEGCKETMTKSDLVDKLGNTDGVKKDKAIKEQFENFKSIYDAIIQDPEVLEEKLKAYSAQHSFYVAVSKLNHASPESEVTAAAQILIDSGVDALATYGEGWVEKALDVARAYQEYKNTTSGYSAKYNAYKEKENEQRSWAAANKPDVKSLYALNIENTSKLNSSFDKLYELIRSTYEKNYNKDSGDCVEFLDEVTCD